MAEFFKGLVDQWGRPIAKADLTRDLEGATVTGVRSPLTGYPADGLNPERLAAILREADQGDPLRYLELAQTLEERDPHYAGVLGTRKRSVSQLEITVEAAGESPLEEEQAERVRAWLKRDELDEELFDILDAVGKGYSFTEIQWDTSAGMWQPRKLTWWDPRWFRFDRRDLSTPLMLEENGAEVPLPGFRFVYATMKAKTGLPLRAGLARIIAWAWMFKMFTQRDWAIFTQNFGQPVRLGKYGPGATKEDRATLFRAVANIAGDCAAIIPESMAIEFVESKNVGQGTDLYEKRSKFLDEQVSKAVLGQTATTDAIAGGHAVGKEHRKVQEDIERADARLLASILNRDLIRPWMMLEYGPPSAGSGQAYPRIRIGRPEETDVKQVVDAVDRLVPLGLKVGQNQVRDLIGLGAPADDDELLTAPATTPPAARDDPVTDDRHKGNPHHDMRARLKGTALAAARSEGGRATVPNLNDALTDAAMKRGRPATAELLDTIRRLVEQATSLEELRAMLAELQPGAELADLEALMRQAMLVAELSGRAELLPPSAPAE